MMIIMMIIARCNIGDIGLNGGYINMTGQVKTVFLEDIDDVNSVVGIITPHPIKEHLRI